MARPVLAHVPTLDKLGDHYYDLRDVHYSEENPLKGDVIKHDDAFTKEYVRFLDHLVADTETSLTSPLSSLVGGPLEALINYFLHTKSKHFEEERECRLSYVQVGADRSGSLPVHFRNRDGLLIPYVKSPQSLRVLDCVEWIIVGPGPRMNSRYRATCQLVRQSGRDIKVRPSHIPFTRH